VKLNNDINRKEELVKLFSIVSNIHCVSGNMAKTISPYVTDVAKVFINRPAVPIEIFTREKDYLPGDEINILSIGRLTFQKGYLIGLLAIKELIAVFPNVKWHIVGDGPQKEELLIHIQNLGLSDHVILAGKKDRKEVLGFYEQTDIFFLPSVSEGIANVVLEAMSMELPVVSSDCSGMPEVITDALNGYLANNYDHKMMAEKLAMLCSDFEMRKKIGQMARQRIIEDYTLDRQISLFEKIYLDNSINVVNKI